ncbi:HD domain-containing protein [Christensenellaceae bacterium OttesenSCG-928-K19]|nr:HD domain-containing protein [Christensenellaceae bacterium OttesenSCG-928-K19]
MRIFCLVIMLVGMTLMAVTAYRYYSLIKYNNQETYAVKQERRITQKVSLVLMFVFIGGFCVGIFDILTRQVEPIYFFVVIIFFLGASFIFSAVSAQGEMAVALRGKTMETMKTFVNAIDLKDAYTKGHSAHVYQIVRLFYEYFDEKRKDRINEPKLLDAALLHDIGKISIKDETLNKPGRLSEEDWANIRQHPLNGKKMLDDTTFAEISDWVLYHHERIDGQGYYGMRAEEIPEESRIITIADTYSALCTDRVYRKKQTHRQAVEIMKEAMGTQLDTELMQIFLRIPEQELETLAAGSLPQ